MDGTERERKMLGTRWNRGMNGCVRLVHMHSQAILNASQYKHSKCLYFMWCFPVRIALSFSPLYRFYLDRKTHHTYFSFYCWDFLFLFLFFIFRLIFVFQRQGLTWVLVLALRWCSSIIYSNFDLKASKHAANYCIAVYSNGLCSQWPEVNHNFHAICIHFRNWIRWQHIILIKRNNKSPKKNEEETFILPRGTDSTAALFLYLDICVPISVLLPSAHRRIWNRVARRPWRRNSQNCKFMDGSLCACTLHT